MMSRALKRRIIRLLTAYGLLTVLTFLLYLRLTRLALVSALYGCGMNMLGPFAAFVYPLPSELWGQVIFMVKWGTPAVFLIASALIWPSKRITLCAGILGLVLWFFFGLVIVGVGC